eukprot:TRINITY_DN6548_c0_g1_i3.p1 TRINITY_DN6548_c0_g1~~TRINITY_DN6548_c0_g1_i3.p1  ORF type:complete len:410 (+),score=96.27 TRINITY_DN6548_c0_g1_i3:924-2153(+)
MAPKDAKKHAAAKPEQIPVPLGNRKGKEGQTEGKQPRKKKQGGTTGNPVPWLWMALGTAIVLYTAARQLDQMRTFPFLTVGRPRRFSVAQIPDLTGRVALVTGASTGLGLETARQLALHNAEVFLACRSPERCERAAKGIREEYPKARLRVGEIDTSSLQSVERFARWFKAEQGGEGGKLHILVLNAGVMATDFGLSADGFELQFATNHLGHFLLTQLLRPALVRSQPSRVVVVSSAAHLHPYPEGIRFESLRPKQPDDNNNATAAAAEEGYQRWLAYGQSKLANVLFAQELAEQLQSTRVLVNAVHPGFVNTELLRPVKKHLPFAFLVTAAEAVVRLVAYDVPTGALTQLYLATSPEVEERDLRGGFFVPVAEGPVTALHPQAANDTLQKELWRWSEQAVKHQLFGPR